MRKIRNFFQLIKAAATRWSADKASVMAAALAFYTGLALAPLLIVMVLLAGIFLNRDSVQSMITEQVAELAGPDVAALVTSMLQSGFNPEAGAIAAVISLISIFFSASSLFAQVENAFNVIWRDSAEKRSGIMGFTVTRLRALAMVFSVGFLLILTVVISTIFDVIIKFVADSPDWIQTQINAMGFDFDASTINTIVSAVLPIIDLFVSIFILSIVFSWMFRRIPSVQLRAKDVRAGAIITAILFVIGKYGLAIYLSRGSVGSAYGAAGSMLVLLIWIYYSAQILLFGVEYTYVDATTFGSKAHQATDSPLS